MEKMEKNENYFSYKYHQLSYISAGLYLQHLKRWMAVFPKNQFFIIQSEEFFRNTPKIFSQVLEFLDVPKFELKKYQRYQKLQYSQSIDPITRKKLIEFCKQHNEKLYSFLDKRFDWD